ncbi:hypothetical protein [Streptomyces sp. ME01-18h]|uniref:hypothetical protein n=1 Tax=Streptomyces sp. ME01-18h TaxID=462920 RepID=UPI0029B097AD|nr:hypothetical protein [Streptomyces sp. ME01-18h]MDX3402954.1 hypothetical protein [Streptomyces sp. ME01-18h]
MSTSDGNAVLVNSLSSSLRSTLNGLDTAPGLIRRVLEEGSWRHFTTPRGEFIKHDTFDSFVTTAPTAGLGKSLDEVVRVIGDDNEVLALLANEIGVAVDSLKELGGAPKLSKSVELDAREFGSFARSGGWIFGLMVARSVTPGSDRNRASHSTGGEPSIEPKVSARQFALLAGTTAARVMRFYRAWERAAEAGLVPGAATLRPGQHVELPASDEWAEYFTKYEQSTDRREGIAQQAEAAGTSYTEAVKVAKNPAAMRTAILGDHKTADAARRALMDRLEDDVELQAAMARTIAKAPELRKAVTAESKKSEQIEYVRRVAIEGKVKTPAGEILEVPPTLKATAQRHFAVLETGDDKIPPESATEAYEAVQQLITETIEGDPEIQLRERRARLYNRLQRAAKAFEDVDPDELASLHEPDIVTVLQKLQQAITSCLESAGGGSDRRTLRAVSEM